MLVCVGGVSGSCYIVDLEVRVVLLDAPPTCREWQSQGYLTEVRGLLLVALGCSYVVQLVNSMVAITLGSTSRSQLSVPTIPLRPGPNGCRRMLGVEIIYSTNKVTITCVL